MQKEKKVTRRKATKKKGDCGRIWKKTIRMNPKSFISKKKIWKKRRRKAKKNNKNNNTHPITLSFFCGDTPPLSRTLPCYPPPSQKPPPLLSPDKTAQIVSSPLASRTPSPSLCYLSPPLSLFFLPPPLHSPFRGQTKKYKKMEWLRENNPIQQQQQQREEKKRKCKKKENAKKRKSKTKKQLTSSPPSPPPSLSLSRQSQSLQHTPRAHNNTLRHRTPSAFFFAHPHTQKKRRG